MPRTKTARKAVRSFRMSPEGVHQLTALARAMGRSEREVLEVALDRMYREELRFHPHLREAPEPAEWYRTRSDDEGNDERNPDDH